MNRPLNIAFFSKDLPSDRPNGVSTQVHRLANALSVQGHSLTCYSFSPKPQDALYTVRSLDWGTPSRLLRKFVPAIRFARCDTGGFEILHYHGDDYLCRGGCRRIRTFYGSAGFEALHAGTPSRLLYQSLFYLFEMVSCFRTGEKAGISAVTARALPFIRTIIPCGVPLDRYFPEDPKSETPSILFLGDLGSRKRGKLMLEVFKSIVLPAVPGCTVTVVGPERCDGPGVRWRGTVSEDDLIREYRRAWVLCVPSSYEGLGVPAIEAMACGTAVVSTPNAGAREVVVDGRNGMLCGVRDLGAALVRILGDHDERNRLAAGGVSSARTFDIIAVATSYERLYREMIARNGTSEGIE